VLPFVPVYPSGSADSDGLGDGLALVFLAAFALALGEGLGDALGRVVVPNPVFTLSRMIGSSLRSFSKSRFAVS
jgi:hypothetical protein